MLHVINNLNDLGGAELALLRLVGGGDGARFEHRVVALLRAERLGAEFEAAGVAVSALDIRRGAAAAARRIATLLRAPAPDVIVGWLYYGNIAASLLGAMRRAPFHP